MQNAHAHEENSKDIRLRNLSVILYLAVRPLWNNIIDPVLFIRALYIVLFVCKNNFSVYQKTRQRLDAEHTSFISKG